MLRLEGCPLRLRLLLQVAVCAGDEAVHALHAVSKRSLLLLHPIAHAAGEEDGDHPPPH
jgi:hypothetical protein